MNDDSTLMVGQYKLHGYRYKTITDGHEVTIIITERGSRIRAMIPAAYHDNAFWIASEDHFNPSDWNSGGDRTWISPEFDYFHNTSGEYDVPPQLDPENWRFTGTSHESTVTTEQDVILQNKNTGSQIQVNLKKRYKSIPNPFEMNHSVDKQSVQVGYIGCQTETQMVITPINHTIRSYQGERHQPIVQPGYCNLWSIMQVPADGIALIPTRGMSNPTMMSGKREYVEMVDSENSSTTPLQYVSIYIQYRQIRPSCFVLRAKHVQLLNTC